MHQCYLGAEAEVCFLEEQGKKYVIKKRISKQYRIKELDEELRRERNKTEYRIMEKLRKAGINVPRVFEHSDYAIKMEYIEGKCLYDVDVSKRMVEEFALNVAEMHDLGIIHGDLTLKNVIWDGKSVFLIDFGLSYHSNRYEDKATDLYILEETSKTKNFPLNHFYECYFSKVSHAGEIKQRLEKIRRRRRYLGGA